MHDNKEDHLKMNSDKNMFPGFLEQKNLLKTIQNILLNYQNLLLLP